MALIYVAGINHYDPFHRRAVHLWFEQILAAQETTPGFVANEWTADSQEFARAHRQEFGDRAKVEYPMLDAESRETLASSFAYEGDLFDELVGHDKALWLGHETDLTTLVDHRINRCHEYVDYQGVPKDGAEFLRMLSIGAQACGQPPGPGDERDGELAARIHIALDESEAEWALAILGANHAYRYDSTSVDLLSTHHDCHVRVMLANGGRIDI